MHRQNFNRCAERLLKTLDKSKLDKLYLSSIEEQIALKKKSS